MMSTNLEPEYDFSNPIVRERFHRAYRRIVQETARRREEQAKVPDPTGVTEERSWKKSRATSKPSRLPIYEQLSLFS
jgi:hypothetical protein